MKARGIRLIMLSALLLVIGGAVAYASVTLSRFVGEWNASGDAVLLEWETGSEFDHAYFNLWRSTENLPIVNGKIDTTRATWLNEAAGPIICSTGSGDNGCAYSYTDEAVNPTVETYYYYLESVGNSGASEFAGDPSTNGGLAVTKSSTGTMNTYLPLISRR